MPGAARACAVRWLRRTRGDLTGVDLSAGMLEQAKAKQVYDELVQGELTQFLQGRPAAFDLIVSADTLVYFGDLEDVAAAARAALRPGGLFVFTLEELVVDDGDLEMRLEPHGRYAHAQSLRRAGTATRRSSARPSCTPTSEWNPAYPFADW